VSKLACIAALYLLAATTAFAVESADCPQWRNAHPDVVKLRAFLCESDVDALEKYFAGRQREYESGAIDDGQLFWSFDQLSPSPYERLEEWLKRYPDSYSAHVAMADAMVADGLATRSTGLKWISLPQKYITMYWLQHTAKSLLERSLSLTGKPYLSYYYLVRADRITPTPFWRRDKDVPSPAAKAYMDKAAQVDRGGFVVRAAYMISMEPSWNGNVRAMRRHYEDSLNVGLNEPQLARLQSMVLIEEAQLMDADTQADARLKLTIQSNNLYETSRALRDIIWLKMRAKQWAAALPDQNRAIERNPGDYWVRCSRAKALFALERHPEAFKDFLVCARSGDAFAQNKVGWYLWTGTHVPQNKREGMLWFARSAAGGDMDGINNLRMTAAEEVSLRVEGKR
jgi:TPR repeat protein